MNESMNPVGAATPPGKSKIKKFFGVCGRFFQKYSYFFAKIGISLVLSLIHI